MAVRRHWPGLILPAMIVLAIFIILFLFGGGFILLVGVFGLAAPAASNPSTRSNTNYVFDTKAFTQGVSAGGCVIFGLVALVMGIIEIWFFCVLAQYRRFAMVRSQGG